MEVEVGLSRKSPGLNCPTVRSLTGCSSTNDESARTLVNRKHYDATYRDLEAIFVICGACWRLPLVPKQNPSCKNDTLEGDNNLNANWTYAAVGNIDLNVVCARRAAGNLHRL